MLETQPFEALLKVATRLYWPRYRDIVQSQCLQSHQVELIRHLLAQQALDHSRRYTFNKACCYGSLTAQIIGSGFTPRSYDNITKLVYLIAQDHLDLTPIMSNEDPIDNPHRVDIRVLIHRLDHDRLNRAISTQGLDLDELESTRYLRDDLGQFQSG